MCGYAVCVGLFFSVFTLYVAMLCLRWMLLCCVHAVCSVFTLDVAMLCLCWMLLCYVYAVGCYAMFML